MNLFQIIPSAYRSVFYGIFFLVVLHFFVWLNLHWDVYFPWMHVEIGVLRYLGWATAIAALVLYTITAVLLCGKGKGPFAEFDPPKELVTSGPYRFVRNPISTCVLIMILGEAIAFSSTGVFMMVFVSMAIAQLQAVVIEEPLLLKRFGDRYAEYKSRVPRWIPRISA
jgi:protein-S-isoprenylcysteine O-methyltransferase Ste14